jgi:hypothetical protein
MDPLSLDPDCSHCRVKVPWKEPPYWPDHVPESPLAADAAAEADAEAADAGEVAGTAALGAAEFRSLLVTWVVVLTGLEHAASVTVRAAAIVTPGTSRRPGRPLPLLWVRIVVPFVLVV